MVLVVLGVVALTYYTTVVLVYGPAALDDRDNNNNAAGAWVVLAIYHVLIVMTLWSYFACVLTDPGRVPPGWAPPPEDEEDERVRTSNSEKRRRFCRKCTAWKPERSHHCSVCGRCVLKMDHHCVWVASCVGAYNYKHFILFLLYTFAACVFDAVALASTFVSYWADVHDGSHREKTDEEKMTMAAVFVTFFVDVAFAASLRSHSSPRRSHILITTPPFVGAGSHVVPPRGLSFQKRTRVSISIPPDAPRRLATPSD
jgi:hypothetical protein